MRSLLRDRCCYLYPVHSVFFGERLKSCSLCAVHTICQLLRSTQKNPPPPKLHGLFVFRLMITFGLCFVMCKAHGAGHSQNVWCEGHSQNVLHILNARYSARLLLFAMSLQWGFTLYLTHKNLAGWQKVAFLWSQWAILKCIFFCYYTSV